MSSQLVTITHGFRGLLRPSKSQEVLFAKTFGCCRKLWNMRLECFLNSSDYYTIPQYKEQFEFMKEVDSLALTNVEKNLIKAFKNHKDKPEQFGVPKFKSKYKYPQSYTTCNQKGTVRFVDETHIKIPKVGTIKCKMFSKLPNDYKLTFATISKESDGKYYISLTLTYEIEVEFRQLDVTKSIGLDYSLPHFYVDSNGESADYPHFFYQYQDKLTREQRKLSKMKLHSKNYTKQKRKVARLHKKIANCRLDFCHKLSHKLASQYDYIFVEDINLQHQAEHKNWGKKTNDNGFGMFRVFLNYKMLEQGKIFRKIDKWFPSSKTCRFCGSVNSDLTLNDRTWVCPHCGEVIDRDTNAAINILNFGLSNL